MSNELVGVIIGGVIGILGGLTTSFLVTYLTNRRRTKAIRAIAKSEVTAIKEKALRYLEGQSTLEELGASTPLLTSIASELGCLSEEEAIVLRRAVTLDMELRERGSKAKAQLVVQTCEDTLRTLSRRTKHQCSKG